MSTRQYRGKGRIDTRLTVQAAKERVLEYLGMGHTVESAMKKVDRSIKTWEYWRRQDADFKAKANQAMALRKRKASDIDTERNIDFASFRRRYLHSETYWHQLQWIDLLEGREPRDLHPSQTYIPGRKSRIIINTPPFHAKALALDTPILTSNGWLTIGELQVGQEVYGPDGKPTRVTAKSEVFYKECFRVTVNDGEEFVVSGDHLWTTLEGETLTTRQMFGRGGEFKLPFHEALHMEPVDLPLDPYLLGCWLGDGHTASGQFTTADREIVAAFGARFPISERVQSASKGKARTYNALGLFPVLAELGIKGSKFVPEGYLLGSYEQRQALLQGLMDTDGTITPAGQASFTSTNRNLAEAVLYLASSLGLRPSIREGRATLNGRDCGPKWTVWFHPGAVDCFRLSRKLSRQVRPTGQVPGRGRRARRIVAIEPTDTVATQCITVDNDSHLFLVGRSLVPTHNSTTITIDYLTYRICMDPNFRCIIISAAEKMAKKFLYGIKHRLTHPAYVDLQKAYAPDGGFQATAKSWTANMIYIGGDGRDSGEKDPTAEALGLGGQVYGARADLIVLDDCVVKKNAAEWEKQLDWLRQEVESRVGPAGKVLVVGTRVSPVDLYSELLNPDHYMGGKSPWTYLTQPAVLDEADDPADWRTLWPMSSEGGWGEGCECGSEACAVGIPDANGKPQFPRWDGVHLNMHVRLSSDARTWNLVYMQRQIHEDAVFPEWAVRGSIQGNRRPGPLRPGGVGHPERIDGFYIIGSADLGFGEQGHTAFLVYAVDPASRKRYVLTCFKKKHPTPAWFKQNLKELTLDYGIREWRIEKNAAQIYVTQDDELRTWLGTRGVVLKEHYTGKNKYDANYGVSSMAPLFGEWRRDEDGQWIAATEPLIQLPSTYPGEGVKALVSQLVSWWPGADPKRVEMDLVMALWFAEIRAREVCRGAESSRFAAGHRRSSFLSPRDLEKQVIVNLNEYAQWRDDFARSA